MALSAAEREKLWRDLGRVDKEFAEKVDPFLEGLYRHYFRCDLSGWENVPEGNVLFVGNHNGLLTFEVLMLFHAWWRRYRGERRVLGLAHSIALKHPLFSWFTQKVGAIPADPDIAREALERGHSLMVYPGGEKESMRPFTERKKIDFFQRKGFLRLALQARVPIVPVVSVGAHESYVILHRGEEIAEALGLKRKLRLHGMPITFRSIFLLWCVASGLFTFFPLLLVPAAFFAMLVPLPAKMTFRILPPIDASALYDPEVDEETGLQRLYDRVLGAMQEVMDAEYARRRLPVIG